MPVTGLYFIPEPAAAAAAASTPIQPTLLDRLQKRHQPTPSGLYRFDHRLLRSTATDSLLQYLDTPHLSSTPFALCGNAIITIDRDFTHMLKGKLAALWMQRQTLRGEGQTLRGEGHSYDIDDDLRVRVARLMMGEQVRGVVVEVEFVPVDTLAAGEAVLKDFIDGLDLPFTGKWVLGADKTKEWTLLDTGRLYCELLRFR